MKMTRIFVTLLAALIAVGAHAQNTFFPTKAGTVLTYANNDAKGKAENYLRYTVKNVEGSGGNMKVSYVVECLDKNRKPLDPPMEIPCEVVIRDGVMILDMNQMFVGQLKDPQIRVEIDGVPMELPCNMKPGQSLKDAEITMTIDMIMAKLKTVMKMYDGKCLAVEEVTVPAGTFTCHKVTQTVSTTVMKKENVSRTVSWYAPGIGTVKNETYNDSNKLQGGMELVEIR